MRIQRPVSYPSTPTFVTPSFFIVSSRCSAIAVGRKDETTLWSDVVSKSPRKARPHDELGSACAAKGRLEDAVGELLEAIRLDSHDPAPHQHLGVAYWAKGQADDAVRESARAQGRDRIRSVKLEGPQQSRQCLLGKGPGGRCGTRVPRGHPTRSPVAAGPLRSGHGPLGGGPVRRGGTRVPGGDPAGSRDGRSPLQSTPDCVENGSRRFTTRVPA